MRHKIKSMFVITALVVSSISSTTASANTLELSPSQDCRGFGNVSQQVQKEGNIGITLKDLECDQEIGNAVSRKFIRIRRPDGRTEEPSETIRKGWDGSIKGNIVEDQAFSQRKGWDGSVKGNKLTDEDTQQISLPKPKRFIRIRQNIALENSFSDKGDEDGNIAKNCANGKHFTEVKIEMAKTASKPTNPEPQKTIDCHLQMPKDDFTSQDITDPSTQKAIDCNLKLDDSETQSKDSKKCVQGTHIKEATLNVKKNYVGHVTLIKQRTIKPVLVKDTAPDQLDNLELNIEITDEVVELARKYDAPKESNKPQFAMSKVTGSNNGSNASQSFELPKNPEPVIIKEVTPVLVSDTTTGPAAGSTTNQGGTDSTSSTQE